ncbi:unnamed protein product [Cuscuta europaea]|uniref:Uncharacterized protein n=1 Tax=Cuscuta europaea TaxID=41803 RepID=A0A9P1EHB5_CUSEU|nr:unnamed protein product [Cuscuta europaea]
MRGSSRAEHALYPGATRTNGEACGDQMFDNIPKVAVQNNAERKVHYSSQTKEMRPRWDDHEQPYSCPNGLDILILQQPRNQAANPTFQPTFLFKPTNGCPS